MNILANYPLKKLNTFGMDVCARYFVEVNSVSDLQVFLSDKTPNSLKRSRLLTLGGGSNILFTKDFDGVVIKNNIRGIELLKEDAEHYYVKAGAGEVWHEFVMYCIRKNYAGVENLSLIPGSVGAAPIQNIGAYGVEQKEVFHEMEIIHIQENTPVILSKSDCRFGYRDSIFKHEAKGQFIITSVTYKLLKTPVFNTNYGAIQEELKKMNIKEISLASVSRAVCNIRSSKLPDPEKIGNAGSFFKNPTVSSEKYEEIKKEYPNVIGYPVASHVLSDKTDKLSDMNEVKLAAGWLIEQCGWKGKQVGNTGVHTNQALVLVNYGNATGTEVFELSDKILRSVKEKFDVELEREVVVV